MSETSTSGRHLPPAGHIEDLRTFLTDPIACMLHLRRTYGEAATFEKGPFRTVFAFGAGYNRDLLTQPDIFHLVGSFLGPKKSCQRRLGYGFFNINGEEHKKQRRLLQGLFRKEALDSYQPHLVRMFDEVLSTWRPGQVRDISRETKRFSLRLTSRLMFGVPYTRRFAEISRQVESWLELNHLVSFGSWFSQPEGEDYYELLLRRAELFEPEIQALIDAKSKIPDGRPDLLSMMLGAQRQGELNEMQVVGQTAHLFIASYHTTSYALTWTLFLLAQHPQVMSAVAHELDSVLSGATPEASHLPELSLLDRVIRESMRLLPPVVYFPRINREETKLGTYIIPAGTLVVCSQYISHHSPEYFAEPDKFDPDRWLADGPQSYSYLPFGGGPRMCLGAPLAGVMLKTALAMILQRFRLTIKPHTRVDRKGLLTLGVARNLPMLLSEPDGKYRSSQVTGNIHEMVDLPEASDPFSAAA